MTPYLKLKLHLDRHMYKRGQFKGEAPADSSRRGKNHFRVVRGNGGQMIVRMYNTDLIEVTPDNNVRINMDRWWTSTTKANLNDALHHFIGWGGVGSVRLGGYSQLAFRAQGKTYRYYDGMTFDAVGNLLSPAKVFSKQITDREATKEFREDIKESGFQDVFPVLFAAAEPERWWGTTATALRKFVTQECHANQWPEIAARCKYIYDNHKAALKSIKARCTADMKTIVDTDVTVL